MLKVVTKLFTCILLSTMIFSGCLSKPINSVKPAEASKGNTSEDKKVIPLRFSKAKIIQNIKPLKKNEIKKLYKEKVFSTGKVFVFSKVSDEQSLHGGFESGNSSYDLGEIAVGTAQEAADLVSINETELCSKKLIHISGIMGANYAKSNYYLVRDNQPTLFLSVDGNVIENDIDGDGQREIISSSGTASNTCIYKCSDEITVSCVNSELGAEAVLYSEEKGMIFEAYYKDKPDKSKLFKFNGKEMVQLP